MRFVLASALVLALVLAGCSSGGGTDAPPVVVDPDTGAIRGLVVDQAVTPLAGALILLTAGPNAGLNVTSDTNGQFNFTRLAPGDHVLTIGKPGFIGAQSTATVVAGDPEPPLLKVQLTRLSTASPFVDHFKLDGFYSCTFALPGITDSCEFVYRSLWDGANETGTQPPVPRSLQDFRNTQFIDVPEDTYTIVQEGYWDEEASALFWIMIDETPISNDCDCSPSYGNRIGGMPLINRLERYDALGNDNTNFTTDYDDPIGTFPSGKTVASRGFIPFQEFPVIESSDPSHWAATGVNFQFVVMTTLFHNYVPDPTWTFETKDNFPVG